MLERLQSLFGFVTVLVVLLALSEARSRLRWRRIGAGVGLQVLLAALLLAVPGVRDALLGLNALVTALDGATRDATSFMFGYLAGGEAPFEVVRPGKEFIVAFRVLPLILIVSAVSAVLFHWGLLPWVIGALSAGLRRVMDLPAVVAFAAAASVFLGIIEGPILIRPYLRTVSRADLFAVLVCGMSTVAGTVMVLYAATLGPVLPGALAHLLVASVVSVPAALVVSHLLIPGEPAPGVAGEGEGDEAGPAAEPSREEQAGALRGDARSAMEALMKGTSDGLTMVLNIVAVIIVLFALVHLANRGLAAVSGDDGLTIQRVAGTLLRPVAWLMGVPWSETAYAGELLSVKVILNEYVAYLQLATDEGGGLSPRSRLIMSYALCGFANLGSLGILIGGLGAAVPERRSELIALGWRAVLAGLAATVLTGALIGVIHPPLGG